MKREHTDQRLRHLRRELNRTPARTAKYAALIYRIEQLARSRMPDNVGADLNTTRCA